MVNNLHARSAFQIFAPLLACHNALCFLVSNPEKMRTIYFAPVQ